MLIYIFILYKNKIIHRKLFIILTQESFQFTDNLKIDKPMKKVENKNEPTKHLL